MAKRLAAQALAGGTAAIAASCMIGIGATTGANDEALVAEEPQIAAID